MQHTKNADDKIHIKLIKTYSPARQTSNEPKREQKAKQILCTFFFGDFFI